jgi:iron complex outermembrane receptor protein
MAYSAKTFSADVSLNGSAKQTRFNPEFGEKALPAFGVLNLSVSNRFMFAKQSLLLKAGIENLFDKNYTTFSDWNRLPRMGRNSYLNVIFGF